MPVITVLKGENKMTKLRARQRAKAKALLNPKKKTGAGQGEQLNKPGRFDTGASSIRGAKFSATNKGFSGAKSGSVE
jgi:hypothetical protein